MIAPGIHSRHWPVHKFPRLARYRLQAVICFTVLPWSPQQPAPQRSSGLDRWSNHSWNDIWLSSAYQKNNVTPMLQCLKCCYNEPRCHATQGELCIDDRACDSDQIVLLINFLPSNIRPEFLHRKHWDWTHSSRTKSSALSQWETRIARPASFSCRSCVFSSLTWHLLPQPWSLKRQVSTSLQRAFRNFHSSGGLVPQLRVGKINLLHCPTCQYLLFLLNVMPQSVVVYIS